MINLLENIISSAEAFNESIDDAIGYKNLDKEVYFYSNDGSLSLDEFKKSLDIEISGLSHLKPGFTIIFKSGGEMYLKVIYTSEIDDIIRNPRKILKWNDPKLNDFIWNDYSYTKTVTKYKFLYKSKEVLKIEKKEEADKLKRNEELAKNKEKAKSLGIIK
jgi:hypothetical protein